MRWGRIRKYVVRRFLRPPIFFLFKRFFHPDDPVGQRWQFYGFFRIRPIGGRPVWLYNNSFKIETGLFWAGADRFEWEQTTRAIWSTLCPAADVVLDIGANTGVFAMLAQSYNPNAHVYAFEPQPNIYSVLERNARRNGGRVRCERRALADMPGSLPFYNSGKDTFTTRNTTTGSLNRTWHPDDAQSIFVEVTTLDRYIIDHGIERIDLIKMDVETFEYEVLVGYQQHVFRHRPTILLEIQTREIGEKIEAFFRDRGYRFLRICEDGALKGDDHLSGATDDDKNFVLCPEERLASLSVFLDE